MWRLILSRIALAAATVLAGGFISATLVRYAPGFGMDEQVLDPRLSSASIAAIRNEASADRAVISYYLGYLGKLLHGDLGVARSMNRPVRELLAERAGVSCGLAARGLLLAWLAAMAVVVAGHFLRLPGFSVCVTTASAGLLCLPAGAVALLSILVNAPGCMPLAVILFPRVHRYLSNLAVAATRLPHMTAAKARGLSEARILFLHVVPVIRRELLALAGVSVGLAISAAIPVEALCGIPGLGQLAWQSALARDVPLLINLSVLIIAGVTLANLVADLALREQRLAQ